MKSRSAVFICIGSIMVVQVCLGLIFKGTGQLPPLRRPGVQAQATTREKRPEEAVPASPWSYIEGEDEMGRGKRKRASTQSLNTVALAFPYGGLQRGSLLLRRDYRGLNIMVEIEQGQILFDYEGTRVNVRFDQEKATRFAVVGPADHSTTTMFLKPEGAIFEKLKRAQTLQVEVPIYQNGNQVFTFDVAGLKADF